MHWLWASELNDLAGRDHSGCSIAKCHALHLASDARYSESHAEDCDGNCPRSYVQTDQVLQVLSQTHIPLISAKPCPTEESSYALKVVSLDPKAIESDAQYVAFSHVWSDGLGSTTEQGIPSCQARFLARISSAELAQVDDQITFWIDSMCVPRDSTGRKKAIELMSETYQLASTVLVLDNTIRKVALNAEYGKQNSPEVLLRIYTSPWNYRVWTYQEGGLAPRLVFLLADEQKIVLDFALHSGLREGSSEHSSPFSLTRGQAWFRHVYSKLYAEVRVFSPLAQQRNVVNIGTVAIQLR